MEGTAARAGRPLRALVFAAAGVGIAAAAHRIAHGAPPSPVVLTVATLAVAGLVAPFAGPARSGPAVGATMVAAQGALHLTFTHTAGGGAGGLRAVLWELLCVSPGMATPAPSPGITSPGIVVHAAAMGMGATGSASGGLTGGGMAAFRWEAAAGMTLAHLTAALLTAVLLRHCDEALVALGILAAVAATAVARVVTLPARRPRPTTRLRARSCPRTADRRPPRPRPRDPGRTAIVHRGPPAGRPVTA